MTYHDEIGADPGGGRTEAEIATQPDCWRRAAALLPEVVGLLPAAGERVAVAGCGTSWFMAQAYAAAREAAGQGETDAFTASERSEEHTSELQSLRHLVCRLLLEKKNKKKKSQTAACQGHNK